VLNNVRLGQRQLRRPVKLALAELLLDELLGGFVRGALLLRFEQHLRYEVLVVDAALVVSVVVVEDGVEVLRRSLSYLRRADNHADFRHRAEELCARHPPDPAQVEELESLEQERVAADLVRGLEAQLVHEVLLEAAYANCLQVNYGHVSSNIKLVTRAGVVGGDGSRDPPPTK